MTAAPAISPGLPVEVGEIDRQLGRLWERSDAAKVRASLVNLVIYSEAPDAIEANTPLLSEIAGDHAFRALLVQADPHAGQSGARAWITAHCHLREAGKKEICSEQITFQLGGSAAARLPSIVFSHLDSDLPLYLWWQGELHPDPEPQLWRWVDRLIVDSAEWLRPATQFRILREIASLGHRRSGACDLNWTRLFHLRYAVAQVFDSPAARDRLGRIENVVISHAPGRRLTALELLGWIVSRLRWQLDLENGQAVFRRLDRGIAHFEIREQAASASCIDSVRFEFGDATAAVRRESTGDFYLLEFGMSGAGTFSQLLPAGREKMSDVLLSELSRGSRHPLFWPAIETIEPLLTDS